MVWSMVWFTFVQIGEKGSYYGVFRKLKPKSCSLCLFKSVHIISTSYQQPQKPHQFVGSTWNEWMFMYAKTFSFVAELLAILPVTCVNVGINADGMYCAMELPIPQCLQPTGGQSFCRQCHRYQGVRSSPFSEWALCSISSYLHYQLLLCLFFYTFFLAEHNNTSDPSSTCFIFAV